MRSRGVAAAGNDALELGSRDQDPPAEPDRSKQTVANTTPERLARDAEDVRGLLFAYRERGRVKCWFAHLDASVGERRLACRPHLMCCFMTMKERKASTGRPTQQKTAWDNHMPDSEVMQRIALCAKEQRLTMLRFSKLAGRDRTAVKRSLSTEHPQAGTIAAYCTGLGLPLIAHHALTDEMNERDVESVVRRVAATGALDASDTINVSKADIARAARAYVLAEHRLDTQRDPLQAFLTVLDPTSDVLARLRARRGDYPERVIECAELIRQRVPAAAGFTDSDLYQLCGVLADYVPAEDPAPALPHTTPIPELVRVRDALGHEAEKRANDKPLPKYVKKY